MDELVRGHRPAAPEPVRLVQEFVNTIWLRTGEETWTSPEDLRRWLVDRALLAPGTGAAKADLILAVRLREALRELLARTEHPDHHPVLQTFRLRATIGPGGRLSLEPSGAGIKAALTWVLVAGFQGIQTGAWDRLKVCTAPDCRWVYFDPSRNRSAVWCNMAICGSRAKSNAYYQRQRRADRAQRLEP